jgi:hypothetical protein
MGWIIQKESYKSTLYDYKDDSPIPKRMSGTNNP